MMYLIVLFSLVAVSLAQRPSYAGSSPKGYPELASRFRGSSEEDDNATNAIVGNRLGEGDADAENIPTDARGDAALVNRLNQWPRENRPFWLVNAAHIEKHRHPERNNQSRDQQGVVGVQPTNGQTGQVQSRLGESLGSETRTIKPLIQRGSFAGNVP